MASLSLFSIGFRAENIFQALALYSNEHRLLERHQIDEMMKIIEETKLYIDQPVEALQNNVTDFRAYLPLLFEAFEPEEYVNIESELTSIIECVQKTQALPNVDVTKASTLFQRLTNVCILKANETRMPMFSLA